MIVSNQRDKTASQTHKRLLGDVPELEDDPSLIVAVGGDGFMLHAIARHGFEHTYLGINAGHLGFLLNDIEGDWERICTALRERTWTAHQFPTVQAKVWCADGSQTDLTAVNDVYLERCTGQTARLALSINEHRVVEALTADGIIFSTALGSTAYTFSAGGPACHPTLQMLSVTPICPHRPRLSPFALPRDATARVDVIHPKKRPIRAVADGSPVENVIAVEVGLGDTEVTLAYLPGHDFTAQMIRKILAA